jgi:dolichyl-diphosphooligosaccharide--protein glycosyltransferase
VKKAGLLGRALLVYGVALALRLRNVRSVLAGDRVLLGFDDPYYHLRRVLLTLTHFPRVPVFDFYTNFPQGARITWPPGFDLFVAGVSWIAGLGHPTRHQVEVTAALLIPFVGAVTAVLVLLLAEEILGRARWEALAAALLFAFLPAQQAISTVGRLDHHVVEMISFGTAVLFFLRALRDDPGSRFSFWGGVALALGVFCWTGSILYAGFLAVFAAGQMILDRLLGRPESAAGRSALRVIFWGALLLIPLVLLSPHEGLSRFSYLFLSWYQVAILGTAALLIPALAEVIFSPGRRLGWLRAAGGGLVVLFLLGLGGWILVRGSGGLDFLTRKDRVIALLVESTPAWRLPEGQLVEYFSPLLYIAPLAFFLLGRALVKNRFGDVRMNSLLALSLFTAMLGASQARFLNYFAVPYCIVILWALRAGVDALRRRTRKRSLRWSIGGAGALVILLPLAPILRESIHSLPGNVSSTPALPHLYPSLEWMRDRTPKTSHLMEPDKRPEYGVLADFTFGHWVTVIGERPNFCNPFSLAPWHEKPIFESARLFLAEDEGPLVEELDRLRLRYVLLYNQENAIPDYARLSGKRVDDYLAIQPGNRRAIPSPRFFRTFGVRLALFDGSAYEAAGEKIAALSSFRLVHESPETHRRRIPGLAAPLEASRVKIFERVKGARIEGRTDPGEEVTLKIRIDSDAGRQFTYSATTTAARDGAFAFVVPYPTGVWGDTSGGPVVISASHCHVETSLSEEEVIAGARRQARCH